MNVVDYTFVFVNLLIGVGFSILIAPLAIKLANRLNLIDVPGEYATQIAFDPHSFSRGDDFICWFHFFLFLYWACINQSKLPALLCRW